MRKAFYTLTISTIFIGVLALGLNTVFGMQTITYMKLIKINDVYMYKYDFWAYIQNIKNTFTNVAELTLSMPTRTWLATNQLSDIGNNMAYMLDVIIIGLNILLYPFRIVFYTIQMLLSLIGLPTITGTYDNNPLKWLIDLTKFFVTLQIPYV